MATTAEQKSFRRTMLQKCDVPGSDYEVQMGISELAPNGQIDRESHPGLEEGYVLEGTATLTIEGQPALTLKSGQSWQLPASVAHEFRAGPKGVKVLAAWVVEKKKPFASPAK